MFIYQFFVRIGLVFTLLWQACFGAYLPVRKNVVNENGSMAAVDELGRAVVSAGKSK